MLVKKIAILSLIIVSLWFFPFYAASRTLYPINYGLKEAKNGIERYYILLKCHQDAGKYGHISYRGIERIELEIPSDAQSIPLPISTDFSGVTIIVKNTKKSLALFEMSEALTELNGISGEDIDKGSYDKYDAIKNGSYLLIVEDLNPWINNRKGYNYGVNRRDIFFLKDAKACNKPIYSYNTNYSLPKAFYCKVNTERKTIKNIKFIRDDESTEKTFLFGIRNQVNIALSHIELITPPNDKMYGDAAIQISNCVQVVMSDIIINGTYSQKNKFGYGVSLGNIYDIKVKRMNAHAEWGVFGNNYLSNVELMDCKINRFDIHCYGRNFEASNCIFEELYNQFSSIYGKVTFDKCTFTNFVPFLVESSFNAYTPFDLVWSRCTFNLSREKNYLITLFGVPGQYNARAELRRKCLPNITLKDCKVNLTDDVDSWYLIKTDGNKYKDTFDYISCISLQKIKVNGGSKKKFKVYTEKITTTNPLKMILDVK
jgi:hypothetical protein